MAIGTGEGEMEAEGGVLAIDENSDRVIQGYSAPS